MAHTLMQTSTPIYTLQCPPALTPPSLSLYPCLVRKVSACLGKGVPGSPNPSSPCTDTNTSQKQTCMKLSCPLISRDSAGYCARTVPHWRTAHPHSKANLWLLLYEEKCVHAGQYQLRHSPSHLSVSPPKPHESIQMESIVHCYQCFVSS